MAAALLMLVLPGGATVVPYGAPAPSATDIATAMVRDEVLGGGSLLVAASWAEIPGNTPVGTADAAVTATFGMPDGARFGILTTGDVRDADVPSSGASSANGGAARGAQDVVVHRLDLDVPADHNCLAFSFQFLSEEYPTYVGTVYNDAFVAELDASTWRMSGAMVVAPDNFAFAPGGLPVTVTSLGVPPGASPMGPGHAAGTPYGGGSPLYQATTAVTPGLHALYLSIFDAGDNALDSAVFIDDVHTLAVPDPDADCAPGISAPRPRPPPLAPPRAVPVALPPAACAPATVPLLDLSTWDVSLNATAFWSFGDGTTATYAPPEPRVEHAYQEPGFYEVRLVLTDSAGRSHAATVVVYICDPGREPLRAVASAEPAGCAPATVRFTDASVGGVGLASAWDFGDGTRAVFPASVPAVEHRFEHPGVYSVLLQVHDASGRAALTSVAVAVCSDGVAPDDTDLDGVADHQDNCPEAPNQAQEDLDLDGQGDACDPAPAHPAPLAHARGVAGPGDRDGDGVADAADACPERADPRQEDLDRDGQGDACDPDPDGDGVATVAEFPDVCPWVPDSQADRDGDGWGDACDPEPAVARARTGPAAAQAGQAGAPDRSAPGWLLAPVAGLLGALAARRGALGPPGPPRRP